MRGTIAKSSGKATVKHTNPQGYIDERNLNWEVEVTAEPATHGSGSDYCGKITIDNLHIPYMEKDLDAFVKKAIPAIKKALWEQINKHRGTGSKVTVEIDSNGDVPTFVDAMNKGLIK